MGLILVNKRLCKKVNIACFEAKCPPRAFS
jgi:hypothetical protein